MDVFFFINRGTIGAVGVFAASPFDMLGKTFGVVFPLSVGRNGSRLLRGICEEIDVVRWGDGVDGSCARFESVFSNARSMSNAEGD